MKVEVGDYTIELRAPASYVVCSEIITAAAFAFSALDEAGDDVPPELVSRSIRVAAAALGACWQGEGRPKVRYSSCDVLRLGGQVLDELVGQRHVPTQQVVDAGRQALDVLGERVQASMPTEDEVEDTANFTVLAEASTG